MFDFSGSEMDETTVNESESLECTIDISVDSSNDAPVFIFIWKLSYRELLLASRSRCSGSREPIGRTLVKSQSTAATTRVGHRDVAHAYHGRNRAACGIMEAWQYFAIFWTLVGLFYHSGI